MHYRVGTLLFGLPSLLFGGCEPACRGHIEGTVLYFKQAPQGQLVYANVLNKTDLGVQETLYRDDKEFGTFGHIVIIHDPASVFKGRRTVCFDEFYQLPPPADVDLREVHIPRLRITK